MHFKTMGNYLPLPQPNVNMSFPLKEKCWVGGGVGGPEYYTQY